MVKRNKTVETVRWNCNGNLLHHDESWCLDFGLLLDISSLRTPDPSQSEIAEKDTDIASLALEGLRKGIRKNRRKTNESERPHVLLFEGAKDFQNVSFATEFRTCSERSEVFRDFFVAQSIFLCYFLLLLWTKESRDH